MAAGAFAPAKVNLYLHVGAPTPDGFHPLCSLMVFADLGDRIELAGADALGLTIHGPFAAGLSDADNLVLRAARGLIAAARRPLPPVRLILDKQLPVASGLGGGSADAGAALRLLRQAWGLDMDDAALEAVAVALGSDGAACLWGRPAIAEGRGERLSAAPRLPVLDAVLVNPGTPVSTGAVYADYDAAGVFGSVTPPAAPEAFESTAEVAGWLSMQRNDLEAPAIRVAPEVGVALEALRAEPETLLARVSGSGGTCFALCASGFEAQSLADRIARMAPDWWVRTCQLGGPWPD